MRESFVSLYCSVRHDASPTARRAVDRRAGRACPPTRSSVKSLVVLLRWLLPIVAALALVGQSVTTWAAAGMIGEAKCCCPSPDRCKCRDHDGSTRHTELRSCAGGGELVARVPLAAVPPAAPAIARAVVVSRIMPPAPPVFPEDRSAPPEKPPF
jgi:hypothetical protein